MSDVTLGQLINDSAKGRDAIHLAVAPVVAGQDLSAGDHVGLLRDNVVGYCDKRIGIVDPFLTEGVRKGDSFWLCLYPKTVTGIRHHWSHPEFPSEDINLNKDASRQYIADLARTFEMTYEDLMAAANQWVDGGQSTEDHFNDWTIPEDFWVHYAAITGKTGSGSFFTCCAN